MKLVEGYDPDLICINCDSGLVIEDSKIEDLDRTHIEVCPICNSKLLISAVIRYRIIRIIN